MIAHLAPLASYFVAKRPIVIPLFRYPTAQQPFVRVQARITLNAQTSFAPFLLIAGLLAYLLIELLMVPLLALMLVWTMIATCAAVVNAKKYRYFLIFRLFGLLAAGYNDRVCMKR